MIKLVPFFKTTFVMVMLYLCTIFVSPAFSYETGTYRSTIKGYGPWYTQVQEDTYLTPYVWIEGICYKFEPVAVSYENENPGKYAISGYLNSITDNSWILNKDYWASPRSYLIAPEDDLHLWYSVIITQRNPGQIIIGNNDNFGNDERGLTEKKTFPNLKTIIKGGFSQIGERIKGVLVDNVVTRIYNCLFISSGYPKEFGGKEVGELILDPILPSNVIGRAKIGRDIATINMLGCRLDNNPVNDCFIPRDAFLNFSGK